MKKTIVCGLFLGLGMIIGSGITVALRPHFFGSHWDHKMKLSTKERAQVKKLFQEDKEGVKALVEEMEESGQALKTKLKDPNASDEELNQHFQKFHEARQKLTQKRFDMNLKIRKVVGPEKMDNFDVLGPVPFGRPGKGKGEKDNPPPPVGEEHEGL